MGFWGISPLAQVRQAATSTLLAATALAVFSPLASLVPTARRESTHPLSALMVATPTILVLQLALSALLVHIARRATRL